jgi:hypothetical protein
MGHVDEELLSGLADLDSPVAPGISVQFRPLGVR